MRFFDPQTSGLRIDKVMGRTDAQDRSARPLELVSATTSKTGVLICNYRPASRSAS